MEVSPAMKSLFTAALIILLRRNGGEMSVSMADYDAVFGWRVSQKMEPDGKITILVLPPYSGDGVKHGQA